MPFTIGHAAANKNTISVRFQGDKMKITYNAGAKYKKYEARQQALDREFRELNAELEYSSVENSEMSRAERDALRERVEHRIDRVRRDQADNICMVIEDWDLEADENMDLDAIRENFLEDLTPEQKKQLSKADLDELKAQSGTGPVPISGIWLHALPFPDEFIYAIVRKIGEDFSERGAGGKGN